MNLSLINNQRIIHSLEKEVHALNLILRCKVIKLQFDFSLVVSLFKYLFCCLRYDRLYYFAETKYKTGRNIYKFIASLRFHWPCWNMSILGRWVIILVFVLNFPFYLFKDSELKNNFFRRFCIKFNNWDTKSLWIDDFEV